MVPGDFFFVCFGGGSVSFMGCIVLAICLRLCACSGLRFVWFYHATAFRDLIYLSLLICHVFFGFFQFRAAWIDGLLLLVGIMYAELSFSLFSQQSM